jgi:tight adherence protein B
MTTFLISFLAFVAVFLIILLSSIVWEQFFDRRNKTKKQRLQAIQNTVYPVMQSLRSAQDGAFENWLRSRSRRTFKQLENLVQRAHSPLTARRIMGLMLAFFMVVMVLGLVLQTNPLLLLTLAVAVASTPVLWLSHQARQLNNAFADQLPDTLDYISRALRAGHSLTVALGMVGKEFPGITGNEFKAVFDEISFGIPFKEAIGHLADRIPGNDVNFFVIALIIHHETGGNLTEILDGLAKTMRERIKLRGKIRTLSSEGRASAWVLGSMPFVTAGMFTLLNPDYMSPLWSTPEGQRLVLICAGLMIIGLFVLRRMIQIKV